MINAIKVFLYESKSNIGWIHGLLSCIGGVSLAYFTMMLFSIVMYGDYAYKILPSILLTPILMSVYGLWFLFSNTIIDLLKKLLFSSVFFLILISISFKVW